MAEFLATASAGVSHVECLRMVAFSGASKKNASGPEQFKDWLGQTRTPELEVKASKIIWLFEGVACVQEFEKGKVLSNWQV